MDIQVIRAYLNKSSRLPPLPEGLLDGIYTWLYPLYRKNLVLVAQDKKPKLYFKTFQVKPLSYATLEVNKISVKIHPEQLLEREGQYDETFNRIELFMPELLDSTKQSILEGRTERIDAIMSDVRTTLKHELIHFLQFNTKESVGGYPTFYKGYDKLQEDYFISPIEYKTQLLSAVHDFRANRTSYDMRDVKEYLGPRSHNNYFKSLFKRSPRRWKTAVRDFYHLLYRNS